jgi:ABC-type lipoprotein export system ATPase subunit
MATIELRGVTKQYRQAGTTINAIDDVNLTIEGGEFLAIVGRSGSGKTTLLDVCGLLMRPTSGKVLIDGVDAASLSERRRAELRGRSIGFIFQEYNLIPTLNVLGNVMLPLRYSGGDRREGRDRATNLLDAVGLSDRIAHRPDQLSGGQQQRVAIARALVQRPALVLADEPTGAVDTQTASELIAMLRGLSRDEGVTVAIVTHDLDLAARTDRIVRLQDGRVVVDHAASEAAA